MEERIYEENVSIERVEKRWDKISLENFESIFLSRNCKFCTKFENIEEEGKVECLVLSQMWGLFHKLNKGSFEKSVTDGRFESDEESKAIGDLTASMMFDGDSSKIPVAWHFAEVVFEESDTMDVLLPFCGKLEVKQ